MEKTVIELFAGVGGFRVGLNNIKGFDANGHAIENGPFKFVWANQWEPATKTQEAFDCYAMRFGKEDASNEDIGTVDKKSIPDHTLLTGGFPCQDFSVAGKRKGLDSNVSHDGKKHGDNEASEETRGKLYMWMKQVIDIVQPNMFIAENVKGLVSLGDVKNIIQQDFSAANGNDYIVLEPQILHSANYGVPESRERVIFIGIKRSALNQRAVEALSSDVVPEEYDPYPTPTHNYNLHDNSLLKFVTCRDVFVNLPEPDKSTDISQQVYSKAKYQSNGSQGQTEINFDGIGPTIRSEHHGNIEFRRLSAEHGGKNVEELRKGMKERRLTPRECALIQTFPPDYPFVRRSKGARYYQVSASGAYKVIGNAVPPLLAFNIARRIQNVWDLYFDE